MGELGSHQQDACFNTTSSRSGGGWKAAALILGTEFCERLATLGIALNLITYLHSLLHLPITKSANIVTNFLGTSFLMCLFGGFIADTYLGRYTTILISSSIQNLGIILLTISATITKLRPPPCNVMSMDQQCEKAHGYQIVVLYAALYLTALGSGGIKSSVSGFGADQFDETHPKEKLHMLSFFNWFFFAISTGAFCAVTMLVYLQDNVSRGVGYGVSAICMAVAIFVFLLGTRIYRYKPPRGSPLTQIAQVFVAAWRNRKLQLPEDASSLYNGVESSKFTYRLKHTNQFSFLDKAAIAPDYSKGCTISDVENPWKLSTVTKVEEVKMVLRLLPILATTIVFWTASAQMTTFSVEQGETLNKQMGKHFQIPAASLGVFLQASILLILPFYDRILVPMARKYTGIEQGITPLQRIGLGMALGISSMAVAALVEKKRLRMAHENGLVMKGAQTTPFVPMSVFNLVPQYFLAGAGEAFTYAGQLDFFYRESPQGMRSLGTGLCLSTLSLGLYTSSGLVSIINRVTKSYGDGSQGWLAGDLNHGRLDNFYCFLAILSFISFIAYIICASWYSYGKPEGVERGDHILNDMYV